MGNCNWIWNILISDKCAREGLTSLGEILNLLYYIDINISTNLMVINIYLVNMHTNAHIIFRVQQITENRKEHNSVEITNKMQVWVGTAVPSLTWLRPVTTCVCKPEAANTVRAPDDERYAARNMLSLQWTVE
jgi:hypothetical protein